MINYDFWQKNTGYTPPNAGIPQATTQPIGGPTPYQPTLPQPGAQPGAQPTAEPGAMGFGDFNFPSAWGGLEDFYGNSRKKTGKTC